MPLLLYRNCKLKVQNVSKMSPPFCSLSWMQNSDRWPSQGDVWTKGDLKWIRSMFIVLKTNWKQFSVLNIFHQKIEMLIKNCVQTLNLQLTIINLKLLKISWLLALKTIFFMQQYLLWYSWFHIKGTWSVHSFNGYYLSIPGAHS